MAPTKLDNNSVFTNTQSANVTGNDKTTVQKGGNQIGSPNIGPDMRTAVMPDVMKPTISDITQSTTSDILKSLFANFTKDGKFDKGELTQLMQFMKLLGDLKAQTDDSAEIGDKADGVELQAPGTPGTGGLAGSQAPPNGLSLVADNALGQPTSAGEPAIKPGMGFLGVGGDPTTKPAIGATGIGEPTAATSDFDVMQRDLDLSAKLRAADGKADSLNEPTGIMKPTVQGGGGSSGVAKSPPDTAEPNETAAPKNAAVNQSNSPDALKAEEEVDDEDDEGDEDSDVNATGANRGITGGTAESRQTYGSLKEAALADGKISRNEQKALDNYAAQYGIKDEARSQQPSTPSKGDLGQVLKDTLTASLKDGQISGNEAKALSNLISRGAGKNLSAADQSQMLTKFMNGAEKDGTFSNQDLATFNKLLSLDSSKKSSMSLEGPTGRQTTAAEGQPPAKRQGSLLDYANEQLDPYIYRNPVMKNRV